MHFRDIAITSPNEHVHVIRLPFHEIRSQGLQNKTGRTDNPKAIWLSFRVGAIKSRVAFCLYNVSVMLFSYKFTIK